MGRRGTGHRVLDVMTAQVVRTTRKYLYRKSSGGDHKEVWAEPDEVAKAYTNKESVVCYHDAQKKRVFRPLPAESLLVA